jgi:hypothetical protein
MVRAICHCYGESRVSYGKSMFTAMGKAELAMVRACSLLWGKQGLLW